MLLLLSPLRLDRDIRHRQVTNSRNLTGRRRGLLCHPYLDRPIISDDSWTNRHLHQIKAGLLVLIKR